MKKPMDEKLWSEMILEPTQSDYKGEYHCANTMF